MKLSSEAFIIGVFAMVVLVGGYSYFSSTAQYTAVLEPDLTITSFDTKINSYPDSDQGVATLTVVNRGGAPSEAAKLKIEDLTTGDVDIKSISALQPRETQTFVVVYDDPSSGTHYLKAEADYEFVVQESNENNNNANAKFSIV